VIATFIPQNLPRCHEFTDASVHAFVTDNRTRTVLVTGATGRLGKALLPRLAEAGFAVRATSRRAAAAGGPVEWVRADLTTGDGIAAAVRGVDAIVHLASAPYQRGYTVRVEVDGTRHLLEAARAAGVGHLVYLSIVGADRVPWGYFRTKVRAEQLIRSESRGVPWTILRATQFHEFIEQALRNVAKLPFLFTDPGISAQPVDIRDVADQIVRRLELGPLGGIENFGGPEVLSSLDALRLWLDVRGLRRPILRIRIPGKLGKTFRAGYLMTDARPTGVRTWLDYLKETA
jgi:uncharacterized protein YbjT (DUF2867 family)